MNLPNLNIAISKKSDGSMKFVGDIEKDVAILNKRERFLKSIGISLDRVVSAQLEHGNNVEILTTSEVTPKVVQNTDALLTNQKNLFLSITVADCLPIYVYDPTSQVVGIIHAGRKGLEKEIVSETIKKAQTELNLNPLTTLIRIGPSIGRCHYETDLRNIATSQLISRGVQKENIEISSICTYEDTNYFSHRRDRVDPVEAMIAIIGLRD